MASSGPFFRRLLVVIKQTAYEEYSQVSIDVGGRLMDRRRGARLIATEIHRPRVRGVRVVVPMALSSSAGGLVAFASNPGPLLVYLWQYCWYIHGSPASNLLVTVHSSN